MSSPASLNASCLGSGTLSAVAEALVCNRPLHVAHDCYSSAKRFDKLAKVEARICIKWACLQENSCVFCGLCYIAGTSLQVPLQVRRGRAPAFPGNVQKRQRSACSALADARRSTSMMPAAKRSARTVALCWRRTPLSIPSSSPKARAGPAPLWVSLCRRRAPSLTAAVGALATGFPKNLGR